MIVNEPSVAMQQLDPQLWPVSQAAVAKGVFLVQPEGMWLSSESASDNAYMQLDAGIDPQRALAQHRELAQALRRVGLPVLQFPGDPKTPDAVFPNNVFACAQRDRFIIGAMRHPGRQLEAERADVRAVFCDWMGYQCHDLRGEGRVAELTGCMVIDRGRSIGFCGLTERVNSEGLAAMHDAFDLRLSLAFALRAGEYHTNVVMSVLASRALVLHREALADPAWVAPLTRLYGEHCLFLDQQEINDFAGNCIALTNTDLFMSARAERGLSEANRRKLLSWGFRIHAVELDELEKAGGSLRCCVAEVF